MMTALADSTFSDIFMDHWAPMQWVIEISHGITYHEFKLDIDKGYQGQPAHQHQTISLDVEEPEYSR